MALVLASSLQGLAASGHFPRRYDPFTSGFGQALLFGSIVLALISLAAGTVAGLRLVPWHTATIGGGLSILAAPPLLRVFPDSFVDGRGALLTFATAGAGLACSLVWIAAHFGR